MNSLRCLLFATVLFPSLSSAAPGKVEQLRDGILVPGDGLWLKLEVRAANIIRVAVAPQREFFDRPSLVVLPRGRPNVRWAMSGGETIVSLRTEALQVQVNRATLAVTFFDAKGAVLLAEQPGGRRLEAVKVQGEQTFHVRQSWVSPGDEGLYGLGQQHLGFANLKGRDLDLWQHNGTSAVPFLVSTRGYGILWDNPSFTRFGDLREPEAPPANRLFDVAGKAGGLTATYFAGAFARQVDRRTEKRIDVAVPNEFEQPNHRIHRSLPETGTVSVRWEGFLEPAEAGVHTLETFANGDIKLWLDDRLVIDHWRQDWLPWLDVARVPLERGRRHKLRVEWIHDKRMPTVRLRWKIPTKETATTLWSEVGEGVDYYLVHGAKTDDLLAGYRRLTGAATLMPEWAFGLWQSRERYQTAQESLAVVDGYRSRGIPFDNIVQDWQYWRPDAWGSHAFDPARFPDPDGWMRAIHERHARLMLSVWGKYYTGTANFTAMRDGGFLYPRNLREHTKDWLGYEYSFYDAFHAGARQAFWEQIDQPLFRRGVDAWWMDATEPDLRPQPTLNGQRDYVHPTAAGTGARVLNAYPLVNSQGVYEGQRAVAPDQRVFILTRSGFAGIQRYATAIWSGDISTTWTAFRKQIPAGLGASMAGLPYWTMDSGGFSAHPRFDTSEGRVQTPAAAEEWRELNVRWFQFAAFAPLCRLHGQAPFREIWEFGGESHPAYAAMVKMDRLRYRLLPYLYSVAGAVTHDGSTFLRPLAMDFPADAAVRDVDDQYLFGPALLVSPVTAYQARSRSVRLPAGGGWYDFWTGAALAGGQLADVAAPLDQVPLQVRAGAIVPFGPELQYTREKPADPVTLFVYTGANGAFTLYEDDGLTYGYERGEFARIPLQWNEAAGTLTIGARQGTFPGMLAERTFHVVFVAPDKPVGFSFEPAPDQTVRYAGEAVEVKRR